ncbi:MAG TPA: DUF4263 domain-containing protein [Lacipirellulaceae bacterium]|nr:DUF4263 domain-containing protein [Verrucomicrobiota bacterium]HMO83761.1 DUF4263 domain-containing protein [Lacipirellulaceae bacterium]
MIFDKDKVREDLDRAFAANSELELLEILKNNSFLFYDLSVRKIGVQPNFCEVEIGSKLRCDFCWLNDSSDGPEWTLVEVEKPTLKLFKQDWKPTAEFNSAIEQVKSWERYFQQHPHEKSRIFTVVSRFRFILIAGRMEDWQPPEAAAWRLQHNQQRNFEIRSMDTFRRSIDHYYEDASYRSFEQHPISRKFKELSNYCRDHPYLCAWRNRLC